MSKCVFLVASLLVILVASKPQKADEKKLDQPGGYEPIRNISEPYVQNLGKFAVDEHNKQVGSHLKYERVISGSFQIVSGTNYKLRLSAIDQPVSHVCGAILYKDIHNNLHLNDFFPITRI